MSNKRKVLIPVFRFTDIKEKKAVVFISSISKCGHSRDPVKTLIMELVDCWFDFEGENWVIVNVEPARDLTPRGLLQDQFGLICKIKK